MTPCPTPEDLGPGVRRGSLNAASSAARRLVLLPPSPAPYRDAAATAHYLGPQAAGNLLSSRGDPGQRRSAQLMQAAASSAIIHR
jgi:hypothetical protein